MWTSDGRTNVDELTINTVIAATAEVLGIETGKDLPWGATNLAPADSTTQEVTAVVNFTGGIVGAVSIGMSKNDAIRLIGIMMGSPASDEDEALVQSVVAELSNMVAGRIHAAFSEMGTFTNISVPTVVEGIGAPTTMAVKTKVAVPFGPEPVAVELQVALAEYSDAPDNDAEVLTGGESSSADDIANVA